MDWRPMLIGTAASVSFMALSLAGAFALVSLSPVERLPPASRRDRPAPDPALLRTAVVPARPAEPDADPSPLRDPSPEIRPAVLIDPPPAPPARPEPGPAAARAALPDAPPHRRRDPPARVAAHEAPYGTSHEAAPMPRSEPRPRPAGLAEPRARPGREAPVEGMVTPTALRRFRSALHLTREQAAVWRPVEQALRQIGAQQSAMLRAGQDPKEAFGFAAAMRIYAVARPFLDALREDQRGQVRAQARSLGFGSVAAQI